MKRRGVRWWPPVDLVNLRRIHRLRVEARGDDAETLARMFEDDAIVDDSTLWGRLAAVLAATEHRWVPGIHTPLDVTGLYELRGFSDVGFRREFRDPWPLSRDQDGHLLTALALALHPDLVARRRFGLRVRDLAGAARDMTDEEVALRLIIGHEKAPDPRATEPLILVKVRRQFRTATAGDVSAFREALTALGEAIDLDLERTRPCVAAIAVGTGRGNSIQDLMLSLAAYHLAALLQRRIIADRAALAAWLRKNLAAPGA
jgi:hypothetical protein